ncbi:MAG: rod shape-determining protein MreC [Woeseiaceae bacterium]|nr:rod shape-determining protein MreC [Woeseiaceae bacterium]
MVASRGNTTNPARIPVLGLRTLFLIALSIVLMALDNRENHLNTVRDAIAAAVYPIQVVVDAPVRFFVWINENTQSRNELELENARLKAEKLLTSARLLQLESLKAENDRLREMLEARQQVKDEVRVAEIMGVDANPFRHSIVIDVGSSDGVYDGQAIVDADGVVGQVIETGPRTSQALLISDPDHTLPVEVLRNGLRTIAFGTGELGRLDLPFLPNNADIEEGDLLVTSGLGGAFPPGYPVARVGTVLRIPQQPFADVSARPLAALDQVREVMLIWPGEPEPAQADAVNDAESGNE